MFTNYGVTYGIRSGGHVPVFVAGLDTLERGLKQCSRTLPAKVSEMANPLGSSLTVLDDS